MSTIADSLAREIESLVRISSFAFIENIAQVLQQSEGISREILRAKLVAPITNVAIRAHVENLFRIWQNDAAGLGGSALGLALLSAARVQETYRRAPKLDLVWTGPESKILSLRRTDQALLQLIDEAEQSLLIVSFTVYKIPSIAHALISAAQRSVTIRICIESPQESEGRMAYNTLRALGDEVVAHSQIYIWPLSKRATASDGRHGSLHAKVAVADSRTMLLSSANLTDYAMNLNMELGILIREGSLPAQVQMHFEELIAEGTLQLV